jgi:RHS repeat-associated protein
MRKNGAAPTFLFSDHLGSTTVTYQTASPVTITWQNYSAWGEVRPGPGNTLPTDFTFTGQKTDSIGLYFYNARYFDASLGRFVQADTVIPDPYSPLSYDRYAYANNSPINLNDPTGHTSACGFSYSDPECKDVTPTVKPPQPPTTPTTPTPTPSPIPTPGPVPNNTQGNLPTPSSMNSGISINNLLNPTINAITGKHIDAGKIATGIALLIAVDLPVALFTAAVIKVAGEGGEEAVEDFIIHSPFLISIWWGAEYLTEQGVNLITEGYGYK